MKDARRLRRAVGDFRWRTLGRWRLAARAEAVGKHAPVRSVLVGPASFADRDLVFQDFSLVLVPGMRLLTLPARPARACGAFGAHQSLWAASRYSAQGREADRFGASVRRLRRAAKFVGSGVLLRSRQAS